MPVTRHFYESEEVVEALRWSVVRGRVVEAAFWCEELVCSGEEGQAWGALFSVWMEQALIVVPDWADVWFGTGGDIQEACAELCHVCKVRRDISLPLVLLLGKTQTAGVPPEGVPALPPSHISSLPFRSPPLQGADEKVKGIHLGFPFRSPPLQEAKDATEVALYDYFERSCAAGKAQAAWWAAQQLGNSLRDYPLPSASPRLFDYLERLVLPGDLVASSTNGAGSHDGWRLAFMCAAVLLECEGHLKPFKSLPKRPTGGGLKPTVALGRWEGFEGRRSRREFAIPREALLCVTERGRMRSKENNLGGLYHVHERIETGEGCTFWIDTLATYLDRKGCWATEEAQDAFYEFAFPDDIPDEWSKTSQLQSHGPGCLSSTEEARWAKWGRLWLEADAVFAWGIPSVGLMESLAAPVTGTETWLDALCVGTERDERKAEGVDGAEEAEEAEGVEGVEEAEDQEDEKEWGGTERVTEDPVVLALLTPVRKMLIVE